MNKLLLIEDDDFAFLAISQLLKGIGYSKESVVRCCLMQEVMALEHTTFQLVITDLSLPDSDYAATFSKVHDKFNYIPIIVLTGLNEIDFAIKTIQNGAQDYLVKGDFDQKILSKAIHYAIERKKIANDYTRIFNESPVPMYIFDSESSKFLSVNTASLEQYGYTKDEFLTLQLDDIRPKENVAAFKKAFDSRNEVYLDLGQWRHMRKNGELFYVHIYAHNTWFEGKNAWINSAINIDKKVAAEHALLEKTKETENILQSITDGFYTLNNAWQFTYVNKETIRTLKHKKEELIGKCIWDIFPEEKESRFYSEYLRAKKENVSVHFVEKYPSLGIWASVNAYPTKDGLTVYFVDITEQHNHLEMIEQQNKRLREIAWIQSHEVRGPVANIQGLLQLFNTEDMADPGNIELFENLKEATASLDEITRRITAHTFIAKQ